MPGLQRRSPPNNALKRRESVERHDHFVMVDHAELPTDQFIAKIRIYTARVEQVDAVAKLMPLRFDRSKFALGAMKLPGVIAPGKNTV